MSIFDSKTNKSVAEAVMKVLEAEHKMKMAKKDHDQDGKIESGKDEYLGSRIRAAKMAGKLKEDEQLEELSKATVKSYVMKKMEKPTTTNKDVKGMTNAYNRLKNYKPTSEEVELDEAFPTVADGEKNLKAKEGKTSKGTLIKTKTGVRHERDYDDEKEPEEKRGRGRPKKRLSEMRQEWLEFMEEVDNETFTKELEDQKAKFAGKKKGGDVAKPSVQAVKQEEVEQIDELSKGTLGRYIKKAHFAGGMADFKHGMKHDKRGDSKEKIALAKTSHKREKGINKAVDRLVKKD